MAVEYPRHVHGPGGAFLVVETDAQKAAALANGWSLEVVLARQPVPEEPVKRGPGRPKKNP